ncbi:MAG TPA: hypothetical protein VIA62_16155 [Thermoanaerobaculia bacterium]|jgi:hypothetical protein|nr:hypothetical protein [Thermoanaerobaculia bacterium]
MAQRTAGREGLAPVLLDLGKIKGKTVRQFKEGRGRLADEIQQVVAEVRQDLGPEAASKELVPIVVVYRKKRRRRKRGGGGGMFGLF